jgi:hypothetical protein
VTENRSDLVWKRGGNGLKGGLKGHGFSRAANSNKYARL